VELVVVAVSDGAFLVVDGRDDDAAGRLHGAGVGNIDHLGHAASNGKRGTRLHGEQEPAVTDKALEIGETLIAEAAADIRGGIEAGGDKVGSVVGVLPGSWPAAHGQSADDRAKTSCATAAQRGKNQNIEFFAEIRVFAQPGVGDVGRSEEHTSELQSRGHLVCRLLLEKKKNK